MVRRDPRLAERTSSGCSRCRPRRAPARQRRSPPARVRTSDWTVRARARRRGAVRARRSVRARGSPTSRQNRPKRRQAFSRGGDFNSGFHAGASEISDDVSLLKLWTRPCDRVAFAPPAAAIDAVPRRRGRLTTGRCPGIRPAGRHGGPASEPPRCSPSPTSSRLLKSRSPAGPDSSRAEDVIERRAVRGGGRAGGDVDEVRGFIDRRRTRRRRRRGGGKGIARGGAFTLNRRPRRA